MIAKALELWELGFTWTEISARVGVPKTTIFRAVGKMQAKMEAEGEGNGDENGYST